MHSDSMLFDVGNHLFVTVPSSVGIPNFPVEEYFDVEVVREATQPLGFGIAWGFAFLTILILFTYGISKAISFINIRCS